MGRAPTPEETLTDVEERLKVRAVLPRLKPDQAALLVLRSHDLSYDELASALGMQPTSVGTLLRRARQAFRKEYLSRHGDR